MEQIEHHSNITFVAQFTITMILWILGEMANYIQGHSAEVEAIKLIFQCFAWGGAGTVGAIAMFNFIKSLFKKS